MGAPDQVTFSAMSSAASASAIVWMRRPDRCGGWRGHWHAPSTSERRRRCRRGTDERGRLEDVRIRTRQGGSGRQKATFAPARSSIFGIEPVPSTSMRDHSRQNGAPAGSPARIGRPIERGSVRPLTRHHHPDRPERPRQDARPKGDRPPHRRASAPARRRGTRPSPDAMPQRRWRSAIANRRVVIANERLDLRPIVGRCRRGRGRAACSRARGAHRGMAAAPPPVCGCTRRR